jgi:hypothetical protein
MERAAIFPAMVSSLFQFGSFTPAALRVGGAFLPGEIIVFFVFFHEST